jgi:hypothetical protein
MTSEPVALQAVGGEGSNFRFYDNRQKYLMFVNTCSEKWVIAQRVAKELETLSPRPPALRFFDAGVGDGTVLARVLRSLHRRFERVPFYIAAKEISLEDIRLTLDKMPDRFLEHPELVLALTNMPYADAPWLRPVAGGKVAWLEVPLKGTTTAEFERQILDLQPFLDANWRTRMSPATGRLLPETPAVVVLYREDCRFLLEPVIPREGAAPAEFDLVLASQPFRLRSDLGFKARRVLAPLARALRRGGRMLGIHSAGNDPGLEIVQRVWPGEDPFTTSRRMLLDATREALGDDAGQFTFEPLACATSRRSRAGLPPRSRRARHRAVRLLSRGTSSRARHCSGMRRLTVRAACRIRVNDTVAMRGRARGSSLPRRAPHRRR